VGSGASSAQLHHERQEERGHSKNLALGAAGVIRLRGAQQVFGWTPHFALAKRLRADVRTLQVDEATRRVDRVWLQEELGRRRGVFNATVRHWQSGILASCFRGWVRAISHEKAQKRKALRFFRSMHGGSQDLERKRFVFGRWRSNGQVNRARKARAAESRAKIRRDNARRQVDTASDALRELETHVAELQHEREEKSKDAAGLERQLGTLQDESQASEPGAELEQALAWIQLGRTAISQSVSSTLRFGRWVREGVGASGSALEGGIGEARWIRSGSVREGSERG